MLGQPLSMLLPRVVGIELVGALPAGSTATDLVLTVAELLRQHGVVGKFVEFYGEGVGRVPLENRATIGNMSPEYGSTCTIFPIDDETLRYLRATGRPDDLVALVETYAKEQGLWHDPAARPGLRRDARARPLDGRAVARGPGAAAGSRAVVARARSSSSRRCSRSAGKHGDAEPDRRRAPASTDEASVESFPASDPPAPASRTPTSRTQSPRRGRASGRCSSIATCPVTLADGARVRARRRPRRDRGDHVVHEHVEPVGDDRGRPARAQRGRARPDGPAVGEDVARARFARRHRLLRARRPAGAARAARLRRRRLRLHDVHRQLGPARARDLGGDQPRRPLGRVGAVGQPQLRGSHPSRLPHELPRVAAARRRVRARRLDGRRPRERAARQRRRRRAGVPARPLAGRGRDRARSSRRCSTPRCSGRLRARSSTATSAGARSPRRPAIATSGTRRRRTSAARRSSKASAPSPRRCTTIDGARCSRCSATASRPTTSRRPASSGADSPAGRVAGRARRRSRATSTRTARGAAITR